MYWLVVGHVDVQHGVHFVSGVSFLGDHLDLGCLGGVGGGSREPSRTNVDHAGGDRGLDLLL